ncbi:MAG: hypothetical protein OEY85_06035 [Rhodospirillales bacterium]|nr:hypothetical protein [Rhodospirillales bacterium]
MDLHDNPGPVQFKDMTEFLDWLSADLENWDKVGRKLSSSLSQSLYRLVQMALKVQHEKMTSVSEDINPVDDFSRAERILRSYAEHEIIHSETILGRRIRTLIDENNHDEAAYLILGLFLNEIPSPLQDREDSDIAHHLYIASETMQDWNGDHIGIVEQEESEAEEEAPDVGENVRSLENDSSILEKVNREIEEFRKDLDAEISTVSQHYGNEIRNLATEINKQIREARETLDDLTTKGATAAASAASIAAKAGETEFASFRKDVSSLRAQLESELKVCGQIIRDETESSVKDIQVQFSEMRKNFENLVQHGEEKTKDRARKSLQDMQGEINKVGAEFESFRKDMASLRAQLESELKVSGQIIRDQTESSVKDIQSQFSEMRKNFEILVQHGEESAKDRVRQSLQDMQERINKTGNDLAEDFRQSMETRIESLSAKMKSDLLKIENINQNISDKSAKIDIEFDSAISLIQKEREEALEEIAAKTSDTGEAFTLNAKMLEDAYRESLKNISAAAESRAEAAPSTAFWRHKQKSHQNVAVGSGMAFIGILVLAAVFVNLYAVDILSFASAMNTMEAGAGNSLIGLASLTIPAIVVIWALGQISRVFIWNMKQSSDAGRKVAMIETFIALERDGKLDNRTDRSLMMQAMFHQ